MGILYNFAVLRVLSYPEVLGYHVQDNCSATLGAYLILAFSPLNRTVFNTELLRAKPFRCHGDTLSVLWWKDGKAGSQLSWQLRVSHHSRLNGVTFQLVNQLHCRAARNIGRKHVVGSSAEALHATLTRDSFKLHHLHGWICRHVVCASIRLAELWRHDALLYAMALFSSR